MHVSKKQTFPRQQYVQIGVLEMQPVKFVLKTITWCKRLLLIFAVWSVFFSDSPYFHLRERVTPPPSLTSRLTHSLRPHTATHPVSGIYLGLCQQNILIPPPPDTPAKVLPETMFVFPARRSINGPYTMFRDMLVFRLSSRASMREKKSTKFH